MANSTSIGHIWVCVKQVDVEGNLATCPISTRWFVNEVDLAIVEETCYCHNSYDNYTLKEQVLILSPGVRHWSQLT